MAGPATLPALAWQEYLCVAITPTGARAAPDQDRRSGMSAVLRLGGLPRRWRHVTGELARGFGRPERECMRLLLVAETRGWLRLSVPAPCPPLRLSACLSALGMLSEARLAALTPRLAGGAILDVTALCRELVQIAWLGEAEAGFVSRLGALAAWRW